MSKIKNEKKVDSSRYNDYRKKYIKDKYTQLAIRFKLEDKEEMKLLNYAKNQPSSAQYIKDLIKKDLGNKK